MAKEVLIWNVLIPPNQEISQHVDVDDEICPDEMFESLGELFDFSGKEYYVHEDDPFTIYVVDIECNNIM